MIDITKLSTADIGRWVTYSVCRSHCDYGRIKSWNKQFVYVVFRCGNDWDNFADYAAAPTLAEHLEFEEESCAAASPSDPESTIGK